MRQVLFAALTLLAPAHTATAQGWANKLFKDQVSHDVGTDAAILAVSPSPAKVLAAHCWSARSALKTR